MTALLTSPEAWAALLTLTALEIVLGIDNVIFLSVIVSRIPQPQAKRARQIGLALALVFRILLLTLLVWLIGLTQAVFTVKEVTLSLRDIVASGAPPTSTSPLVGSSRLPAMVRSVLLPEPLGPITATRAPASTDKLTSDSAFTSVAPCP